MEKKIINALDAQKALRDSHLRFAAGMANHKPELIKVKCGKQPNFYFYWKDKNYAYNPENGLCGGSSVTVQYQLAEIGDENSHVRVVETPYGLGVEQK